MEINGKVTTRQAISGNLNYNSSRVITNDYNLLINHPSIGGVELIGDLSPAQLGIPKMFYGTTKYFNDQPTLITIKGALYIYSDYMEDGEGNYIPGIKIGDGKGYLIDAPFVTDPYYDHIINQVIHITPEERQKWNEKVSVYVDIIDPEKLVFTTD